MEKRQKLDAHPKVPENHFPMFGVGCPVEVSSKEEGFTGARFEATVIEAPSLNRDGGGGGATAVVEYKDLLVEEGSRELLRETVEVSLLRPPPPPPRQPQESYDLCDVVDVFYKDAWWTGFVSVVLEEGCGYVVLFSNPSDQLILTSEQLRPHLKWADDAWALPRKKCMVEMLFSPGATVEVNPIKTKNEYINDAWFPARVLQEAGNRSYIVQYDRGEHFQETVDIHHIRPSPPIYMKDSLILLEKVESFSGLGWWSGIVTQLLPAKKYIVDFKDPSLEKERFHHELRPYLEWKNGKWVKFKECGGEEIFVSESVPKISSKRSRRPGKPSTKYNQESIVGKKSNVIVKNSPNVGNQVQRTKTMAKRSSMKHMPTKLPEIPTQKIVEHTPTKSPEEHLQKNVKQSQKIVEHAPTKSSEVVTQKIVTNIQTKLPEASGSTKKNHSEKSESGCNIEVGKCPSIISSSTCSDEDNQPLAMFLKKICPTVDDSKLASQGTIIEIRQASSVLPVSAPQGLINEATETSDLAVLSPQETTINKAVVAKGRDAPVASRGTSNEVIEASGDFLALAPQGIIDGVTESDTVALAPEDTKSIVARDEAVQAGVGNSCIVRKCSFWKQLEEMDVFRRMPQNPHFSPLKEFSEVSREGRAIGYMVGFESLVKETWGLKTGDPRSVYDELLEYTWELKNHGFNVERVQSCLNQKSSLKIKRQEIVGQTQEFESKLIEGEKKIAKHVEEEEEVQKKMKQLEETFSGIRKRKLAAESEVDGLRKKVNVFKGLIEHTDRDFQCLLDAEL